MLKSVCVCLSLSHSVIFVFVQILFLSLNAMVCILCSCIEQKKNLWCCCYCFFAVSLQICVNSKEIQWQNTEVASNQLHTHTQISLNLYRIYGILIKITTWVVLSNATQRPMQVLFATMSLSKQGVCERERVIANRVRKRATKPQQMSTTTTKPANK